MYSLQNLNDRTTSKKFYIDEYIANKLGKKKDKGKILNIGKDNYGRFEILCEAIKNYFQQEWENSEGKQADGYSILLERQKKAIIGYQKEVNFFKDKIAEYIRANNLTNEWFPTWYEDIVEAIFEENWGIAGFSYWKKTNDSSSAKLIGSRIYFMIDGKLKLQPQKISLERYNQLRKALLLRTPKMRLDKKYAEVYMLDGTRITIYDDGLTKEGQPSIVFRKYIIPNHTFEEQASRGTIPYDIIPMFKAMIKVGFNVAFTGAVRTAKTTFLKTWQSYEDTSLEGIMIETDPEIPLHEMMPDAPIIQLVCDGEELKGVVKSILRSDADYIIMAEAREGIAFYIALEVTDRGTRRSKLTAHFTKALDFPYNVADRIVKEYGGSLYSTILKVAQNFHYVFEFVQLKDKSKKRLNGIYEIRYDSMNHKVTIHQICKYRIKTDDWVFKDDIGMDKIEIGNFEDEEALIIFQNELKNLSSKYPMEENNVFVPAYEHLGRGV